MYLGVCVCTYDGIYVMLEKRNRTIIGGVCVFKCMCLCLCICVYVSLSVYLCVRVWKIGEGGRVVRREGGREGGREGRRGVCLCVCVSVCLCVCASVCLFVLCVCRYVLLSCPLQMCLSPTHL